MTFLNFLHERQNETNVSLEDVKELFGQLNGHHVSPELEDAISVASGGNTTVAEGVAWEREYITYDCFARYLLLESNDVFDPERASPSSSYMSEPLNNYWIKTSHDTFLQRTNAPADKKRVEWTDLQSYTLALYRGARALELDVYDGSDGPVVRPGKSSFPDETANSNDTISSSPFSGASLVFADVILTVKYFLQSEPNSLPIILLIENHCSLLQQEKMASVIENVLGTSNLLYRPQPADDSSLPSLA
jgi:hypothetical protein